MLRVNVEQSIELPNLRWYIQSCPANQICQPQQICKVGVNVLSSCCDYSLYAADSLRSEDCSTVQIGIIEILVKWSVETLRSSLVPPRRKPILKLNEPQLPHLLGRSGPQVKMGHWGRTLRSRWCI